MDKDYLLEEIMNGLSELAPFQSTIATQSMDEDENELSKSLKEVELIVEHLASCLVAFRKRA